MDEDKLLTPVQASKLLNVSIRTLQKWTITGKVPCIRTTGNHRRFKYKDLVGNKENQPEKQVNNKGRKICYCRVSTVTKKKDLETQVEFFKCHYPDYEIIKDFGSGINFKRKGFKTLVDQAIQGNIGEVVVTHKDRLCRFGFEFIEGLIKQYSNGKIVVLNQKKTSPEEELVKDLISIITVFSSRLYGLRSHKLKEKIKRKAIENPKNKIVSNK